MSDLVSYRTALLARTARFLRQEREGEREEEGGGESILYQTELERKSDRTLSGEGNWRNFLSPLSLSSSRGSRAL